MGFRRGKSAKNNVAQEPRERRKLFATTTTNYGNCSVAVVVLRRTSNTARNQVLAFRNAKDSEPLECDK